MSTGPEGGVAQALSCHAHRRVIGALGLALPVLLYVSAGVLHVDEVEPWRLLRSVSSYYHTGAVGVFVGILFALSLSLFTYRGYKDVAADRILGFLGGAAASALADAGPMGVRFVAGSECLAIAS